MYDVLRPGIEVECLPLPQAGPNRVDCVHGGPA
jgi:hypothetical protein